MAISLDELVRAGQRSRISVAASLTEATQRRLKTAFLCHSHKDARYVEGVVTLLSEAGWNVYVDWKDAAMPATPNTETARKIRLRIHTADYFLFLATPNGCASRWCPWEIGVADGVKPNGTIFVIPTRDSSGTNYGNEYLGLYRRIEWSSTNALAAWAPGTTEGGTFVRNL